MVDPTKGGIGGVTKAFRVGDPLTLHKSISPKFQGLSASRREKEEEGKGERKEGRGRGRGGKKENSAEGG